ncbi:MAG: hypothetical protein ACHQCF_01735 [Solirubrobacterales bacterium]
MRPISRRLGRAAIGYSAFYLRRRYRRQIRIGFGLVAVSLAVGAYLAVRNVREG